MKSFSLAEQLIDDLLRDSKGFYESGNLYELLQEFFAGFPLERLRGLLASSDQIVRRASLWIISELGHQGCALLEDVMQFAGDSDRYVHYHVLEIIAVCACDEKSGAFAHIVRALESPDEVIRIRAMRLMSNSEATRLKSALDAFDLRITSDQHHARFLLTIADSENLNEKLVMEMLRGADPLTRRYGAIAAMRLKSKYPALISIAAQSADKDIQTFASEG